MAVSKNEKKSQAQGQAEVAAAEEKPFHKA
jgi:hypothetical protein